MDYWEKILTFIFSAPTLCGAAGGIMRILRHKTSLGQSLVEVVGGIITANIICPIVADSMPISWHYTMFFLIGWGGLEFVGFLYEILRESIVKKFNIQKDSTGE